MLQVRRETVWGNRDRRWIKDESPGSQARIENCEAAACGRVDQEIGEAVAVEVHHLRWQIRRIGECRVQDASVRPPIVRNHGRERRRRRARGGSVSQKYVQLDGTA